MAATKSYMFEYGCNSACDISSCQPPIRTPIVLNTCEEIDKHTSDMVTLDKSTGDVMSLYWDKNGDCSGDPFQTKDEGLPNVCTESKLIKGTFQFNHVYDSNTIIKRINQEFLV